MLTPDIDTALTLLANTKFEALKANALNKRVSNFFHVAHNYMITCYGQEFVVTISQLALKKCLHLQFLLHQIFETAAGYIYLGGQCA